MKISIFGIGYVGCISMGCLASEGHQVTGVDVNGQKVALINNGNPTIIEKGIDELIKNGFQKNLISATTNYEKAVLNSEISIICVGTPSDDNGQLNLKYVYHTAEQIGAALRHKPDFHIIVIRSTVFPGTNHKVGDIIKQKSGKQRNVNYTVISNPEFLREGSAIQDYYNPAITVIGSDNEYATNKLITLYSGIKAPVEITEIKVAEMIKYVNNSFHALKISFANEIGNICQGLGIDSYKVMDLFCKDDHLNISPYYFKPGYAYGGSCLPKDLKGLQTIGHDLYLKTPVINSIGESNALQKEKALDYILKNKYKKVGILGLSFKKGTDDLRLSPIVELAEKIIGKGILLKIFDENINISKLFGANKIYLSEHLPHIENLLENNINSVIEESELIIVSHSNEMYINKLLNYPNKQILELERSKIVEGLTNYFGIAW